MIINKRKNLAQPARVGVVDILGPASQLLVFQEIIASAKTNSMLMFIIYYHWS